MHKHFTIAILVVAGIAALVFGALAITQGKAEMKQRFDPKLWRDETAIYDDPPVRVTMIADLMGNKLTTGLSRVEVETLLGPPTQTQYFKDHDLVYWLGPEPGQFSVDSLWLVIDFDDAGALEQFKTVTD